MALCSTGQWTYTPPPMAPQSRPQKRILRQIVSIIERERKAKGLSVSVLADSADVDLSQMVKALSGKSGLSVYSLQRVASVLGLTLDLVPSDRRSSPRNAA